jgi:hypothetical protein
MKVINESEAAKILGIPRQTLGYYRRNGSYAPAWSSATAPHAPPPCPTNTTPRPCR